MSFDVLKQSDVTRKKEEVKIKVGEKEYKFYANEIGYLDRLQLAAVSHTGGNGFTHLIVHSITDENGQKMTVDQANQLSPEHAELFFNAAAKVNKQEAQEKN